MTARTHDLIALASLLTLAVIYVPFNMTVATVIVCLIANIIGALIPDIDAASNRLWDLLPAGSILGKIADKLFFKHRTISHSLLGAWILYLIFLLILPKIFNPTQINIDLVLLSIMIGFGSHLLADSLTKEGIPLFWPLSFKIGLLPFSFLRIKTGGLMEKAVIFPVVLVYIFWLVFSYQKQLLIIIKSIK